MKSRRLFLRLFAGSAIFSIPAKAAWGLPFFGRRHGWLKLDQFRGEVIYQQGQKRQLAWKGMRLRRAGEIFECGRGASATLHLDEGLGQVHVSEKTRFRIKELRRTTSGGRVTLLDVLEGQVRLKVRPMDNPSSRLEIHTPVGMNGVRGTEFGVNVQPSGKASVATLSGKVDAIAQEATVAINKGTQSLTMPGEGPQAASPLQDNPDALVHSSQVQKNILRLVGQTDGVNSILLDGQAQDTDREGNFDLSFPLGEDQDFVELKITTPLGTSRRYKLPVR